MKKWVFFIVSILCSIFVSLEVNVKFGNISQESFSSLDHAVETINNFLLITIIIFGLIFFFFYKTFFPNNDDNKKHDELLDETFSVSKEEDNTSSHSSSTPNTDDTINNNSVATNDNTINNSSSKDNDKENIKSLNILQVMRLHFADIYEYYDLSRTIAKKSFVFTVLLSFGGLFTILYSIHQKNNIGVIGGVIAEFVSATGILVFRLSLKYLKRYHDTLHENERLLTSLAVVEKVYCKTDDDKYDHKNSHIIKNELYKKIIESELKINLQETVILASKDNDIEYKRIFGTEENNSNNSVEQNIEEDSTSNASQQDDENT